MDYKNAKTKWQIMPLERNGELDKNFQHGDFYEFTANNPIKYFKTFIYHYTHCPHGFAFRVYGSKEWKKYQNRKIILGKEVY